MLDEQCPDLLGAETPLSTFHFPVARGCTMAVSPSHIKCVVVEGTLLKVGVKGHHKGHHHGVASLF